LAGVFHRIHRHSGRGVAGKLKTSPRSGNPFSPSPPWVDERAPLPPLMPAAWKKDPDPGSGSVCGAENFNRPPLPPWKTPVRQPHELMVSLPPQRLSSPARLPLRGSAANTTHQGRDFRFDLPERIQVQSGEHAGNPYREVPGHSRPLAWSAAVEHSMAPVGHGGGDAGLLRTPAEYLGKRRGAASFRVVVGAPAGGGVAAAVPADGEGPRFAVEPGTGVAPAHPFAAGGGHERPELRGLGGGEPDADRWRRR
jgi:hypothetical protein